MNPPKYTMTNESITVIWEGKPYTVQKSSPHFQHLASAIHNKNWDAVPGHLTFKKSVETWANKLVIKNGQVMGGDRPLPDGLNQRIVAMHAEGGDPRYLLLFWERLQKNPSKRSVDQLYDFLKHENIPFTKDGCFYAYKAVLHNYMDKHSQTVSNLPGTVNKMPRNQISDDPREACHEGFHVGAIGYVRGFASSGDRIIVCKVDPEHVVCVPYDHNQEKMRVCEYKVIGNMGDELKMTVHDEPLDDSYEEYEESVDHFAASAPPTNDESKEQKKEIKRPAQVPKEAFSKYRRMDAKKLIELTIDQLRCYATYGLKIVGASKIPGGKTALVTRILRERK